MGHSLDHPPVVVQIWQLPALVEVRTLRGHKRGVWAVQFSPTQRALVTSSGDRTIKMWSLQDGSCQRTFEGHLASVLQVSFLSAGQQVRQSSLHQGPVHTRPISKLSVSLAFAGVS